MKQNFCYRESETRYILSTDVSTEIFKYDFLISGVSAFLIQGPKSFTSKGENAMHNCKLQRKLQANDLKKMLHNIYFRECSFGR